MTPSSDRRARRRRTLQPRAREHPGPRRGLEGTSCGKRRPRGTALRPSSRRSSDAAWAVASRERASRRGSSCDLRSRCPSAARGCGAVRPFCGSGRGPRAAAPRQRSRDTRIPDGRALPRAARAPPRASGVPRRRGRACRQADRSPDRTRPPASTSRCRGWSPRDLRTGRREVNLLRRAAGASALERPSVHEELKA